MTTSATPINLATQSTPKPKARVWRTKAQWKSLLEECAASGLTQAAFCQKHRIATSSLCKWRKYFSDQSAASDFIDITEPLVRVPSSFSDSGCDEHWQVELELGPGVVLRVRTI